MDSESGDATTIPTARTRPVAADAFRHLLVFAGALPVMAGGIWLMSRFLIAEGAITLAAFPVAFAVVGALYLGPAVAAAWGVTLFAAFHWFFGMSADWAVPYALLYALIAWGAAAALRRMGFTDVGQAPLRALFGWYLVVGLVAPVVTTLVGVPMLVAGGGAAPDAGMPLLMVSNFISDSFSPVSVGFALLVLVETMRSKRTSGARAHRHGVEHAAWLVLATAAALAVAVFGEAWTRNGMHDATPAFYLLLAWAALRFSLPFAAIATAGVGLLVISCLTFGLGGTPVPQTTQDALGEYANLLALTIFAQCSGAMTLQRALDNTRAIAAELDRARLKRYFSPRIVDELLQQPVSVDRTRLQTVVVMFVDIVGSTGIVETQTPDETVAMLREFDSAMEDRIFAHQGVVDKFMGDGVMAVFGLPRAGDRDVRAALTCSVEMLDAASRLAAERERRGLAGYRVSIGLHYGEVVAGNVGSERNLSFTVVGDTVNVAARLETISRELDAAVVVSDAVVEKARRELARPERALLDRFVRVAERTVRGRRGPIDVWILPRDRGA
jgi:class 3 adenylate cyclase